MTRCWFLRFWTLWMFTFLMLSWTYCLSYVTSFILARFSVGVVLSDVCVTHLVWLWDSFSSHCWLVLLFNSTVKRWADCVSFTLPVYSLFTIRPMLCLLIGDRWKLGKERTEAKLQGAQRRLSPKECGMHGPPMCGYDLAPANQISSCGQIATLPCVCLGKGKG